MCQLSCNVSAQLLYVSSPEGKAPEHVTWAWHMGCTVSYGRTLSAPLHTASQQSVILASPLQNMSAQLWPVSSAQLISQVHLKLSTWPSVGLGCSWSAEPQFFSLAATFPVNFKLSAQVHILQPRCSFSLINWLGCSQSALLYIVTSFAALSCIMSVKL